jgi:hypothetical protein
MSSCGELNSALHQLRVERPFMAALGAAEEIKRASARYGPRFGRNSRDQET